LVQLLALRESLYPTGQRRWRIRTPVSADLLAAYQLHHSDTPVQWELEARLLAGQSDMGIAASMGIPAAVVTAFEKHFYNVRDRLTAGDIILCEVIRYDPIGGFSEGDLRTLWGYFGYAAGWRFLEIIMAVSQGRSLPAWAIDQAPDTASVERFTTVVKALIAVETGAFTLSRLRKLVVLRQQLSEIERNRGTHPPLTAASALGSANYCGLCDIIVSVEPSAPAVSESDSGEFTPVEREFAEVA